MEAVTGAQRSASTLARSIKCVSGAQSFEMCSRRVQVRKQMPKQSDAKSVPTSLNEKIKVDQLIIKNLAVDNIESTTSANEKFNISSWPKHRLPVTKTTSNASQLLKKLLSFTLLTMLYCVISLPAAGLIEAAPVPWTNACGYTLASDSADEQPLNKTLSRAEKHMVFCQLRGNLTKQSSGLQPYMGPKNFAKLWAKHNNTYAFLKVVRRKNITILTWHRQLQVYALTVGRLLERALNYKSLQSTINSSKSASIADRDFQRLQHLNNTLRSILCDLEMSVNLLKGPGQNTTIDVMGAQANIQLRSERRSAEERVDPVDINMVYYKLRRSLLNMRKIINEKHTCDRDRKGAKKSRVEAATERKPARQRVKKLRKK